MHEKHCRLDQRNKQRDLAGLGTEPYGNCMYLSIFIMYIYIHTYVYIIYNYYNYILIIQYVHVFTYIYIYTFVCRHISPQNPKLTQLCPWQWRGGRCLLKLLAGIYFCRGLFQTNVIVQICLLSSSD